MNMFLVVLVSCYVVYSQALECGIAQIGSDQFKKVITECVKDNQTLNKIWDLTSAISSEEDDSSLSSDEEVPISRGFVNNPSTKNVNQTKSFRSKRSRNLKRFNNDSPMSNKGNNYDTQSSTTTETMGTIEDQSEENTGINNNIGEADDVCILQCIFEKLEMTDSNGRPDHKKFAAALLKTASGREMRDFFQESTDQCFQQIEQEDSENPCEYSSKLVMCLAEKGKSNCEDWPTGNLPF